MPVRAPLQAAAKPAPVPPPVPYHAVGPCRQVRDGNAIARLQGAARGGQIVMAEAVAEAAGVDGGERLELELKGKAALVAARVVSAA